MKLKIAIDGKTYDVEVEEAGELRDPESLEPAPFTIQSSVVPSAKLAVSSDFDEAKVCRSPLAGVVIRIYAKPGQRVEANELLLVLDAMKMEIKVAAEIAGTVKSIEVAPTDAVKPHQALVLFE